MTDTNAADLMPCPFCGGPPQIVERDVEPQNDPWYGKKVEEFVLCECGACLFDGSFHEGFWEAETRAAAAWNRRAPIPRDPVGEPTCDLKHAHFTPFYLLSNARRICSREYQRKPNWVLAMNLFALGSTSATKVCREAGIDPDGLEVTKAVLSKEAT
jgi:hypothetical protein